MRVMLEMASATTVRVTSLLMVMASAVSVRRIMGTTSATLVRAMLVTGSATSVI